MTTSWAPVVADHSRTVPSCPADATVVPSGLNVTSNTGDRWPDRVARRRPLSASHTPAPKDVERVATIRVPVGSNTARSAEMAKLSTISSASQSQMCTAVRLGSARSMLDRAVMRRVPSALKLTDFGATPASSRSTATSSPDRSTICTTPPSSSSTPAIARSSPSGLHAAWKIHASGPAVNTSSPVRASHTRTGPEVLELAKSWPSGLVSITTASTSNGSSPGRASPTVRIASPVVASHSVSWPSAAVAITVPPPGVNAAVAA